MTHYARDEENILGARKIRVEGSLDGSAPGGDIPDATQTVAGKTRLSNAVDSAATDRAATPAAVKAAYDRGAAAQATADAALPVVTTPQVYHIDPVGGDDTTAKPTTSTDDASTPYKTYAAAFTAAGSVFHNHTGNVVFRQKAGTTSTEAVTVVDFPGTHTGFQLTGENNTAKIQAASGDTITLRRTSKFIFISSLDISSITGNGIAGNSARMAVIQNCRFGDCSSALVQGTYKSNIHVSSGNAIYGTSARGISSYYGSQVILRDTGLAVTEGTTFTDATFRCQYDGEITVQSSFTGGVPSGRRWNVDKGVLNLRNTNVASFATLAGTVTHGKVFTVNMPESRNLSANVTVYVNAAAGDDDIAYWMGGTSACPFQTLQQAANYTILLPASRYRVIINMAAGTYARAFLRNHVQGNKTNVVADDPVGIEIVGAGADTIIDCAGVNYPALHVCGGSWSVDGVTVANANSGGSASGAFWASGGYLLIKGSVHIKGAWQFGLVAAAVGKIRMAGAINSSATYSFSFFRIEGNCRIYGTAALRVNFDTAIPVSLSDGLISIVDGAFICRNPVAAWTTGGAAITGKKYAISGIGDISTAGRTIPGTLAGTDASGLSRVYAS